MTRELAIIETEAVAVPGRTDEPLWWFVADELDGGGGGNWWVPTHRGLEKPGGSAGFAVTTVGTRGLVEEPEALHRYRLFAHLVPSAGGKGLVLDSAN